MPIFNNWGKPKDTIVNYMKDIEQKFIPALNNKLGTSINNYPTVERETYALYKDPESGVELEISSNNKDLHNRGDLFVNVSYNNMREEAGIVNLNDINDAVEITNIALHELGFETADEIKEKKAAEEQKKQAELEKRRQEDLARQERNRQIKQDIADGKYDEEDPEASEEIEEPDTYDEDKPGYERELTGAINYVAEMSGEGQNINVEWLIPITTDDNNTRMGHIDVDITHLAGNNFYMENKRINPKVQKAVNGEQAKEYVNKVSDKIRTIPMITVTDEKGKEINVPQDYQDDPVDLGIDI